MNEPVSIFDSARVDEARRRERWDARQVRKLRNRLCKRYLPDGEAFAFFEPGAAALRTHVLKLEARHDSNLDGATKLLFRTASGSLLETVILRTATGRTTLCLSSQVGCAAACTFCATGQMKIVQNLTPEEILDQVLQAGQLLQAEGRSLRNLVFMGMGEPFHNTEAVFEAIGQLTAPEMFHFAPQRLLVSTVGIPAAMLACTSRFPAVGLALSLHSVRTEVRERLMPIARKHSLAELWTTIREVNARQSRLPVMLEYLLLAGINDSLEDADQLLAWSQGLRVHVNLIPFNPITAAPQFVTSSRPVREAFAGRLKQAGLKTTIRYSLGQDIGAACGQLAHAPPARPRTTASNAGIGLAEGLQLP